MMEAVKKGLDTVLAWICIVLFAALVLVVCWQVFTRQVLNSPSTWSSVAAQYMFVWLSLFGASYVFGQRGHITVDFVVKKFSARGQQVMSVIVQLIVIAFAVIGLIWGGIRGVDMTWGQGIPGLPFTVGHMYIALPVAGVLITLYSVYHLVHALAGDKSAVDPSVAKENEGV